MFFIEMFSTWIKESTQRSSQIATTLLSSLSANPVYHRTDSHDNNNIILIERTADNDASSSLFVIWYDKDERRQEIMIRIQQKLGVQLLFFNEKQTCLQYIHMHSDKHIFLITSDEDSKDFITIIHSLLQIHSIYIYCTEDDFDMLAIWSNLFPKVWGVFSFEERLFNKLVLDLALYCTEKGDAYKKDGDMKLANINYTRSVNLYNTILD
ncbi:unnamed protein product [Didymodactylos carnosus]|uniref:Uncharacterized protein n=1 Tax=Didymodactylos carnosus TaxID=1234261 RepID=A0A8S2FH06_9BILA|nr:unnamed protein product [Didymodactylos carnosus]CAF4258654.1 unnamed protein product [Didymodactylos carnosus]